MCRPTLLLPAIPLKFCDFCKRRMDSLMTPQTKVPFLDLVTPHQELKAELMQVLEQALSNAGFIGGPMVENFEREFAKFCDARYCVGVNSGTDALRFAF